MAKDDNTVVPTEGMLSEEEREELLIKSEKELNDLKEQLDKKSAELEEKEKDLLKKESENTIPKEPEKDTQTKIEEMKQQIASLAAQKDHFRTKYFNLKEEIERNKKILGERQPEETPPAGGEFKKDIDDFRLEKIEFAAMHRELGRDELEVIETIAKGKGISFEKAYESDLAKITIASIRDKKQKENSIPGPSDRSEFEQKFDFSKMSEEEKKANFRNLVGEAIKAGKNARRNEAL